MIATYRAALARLAAGILIILLALGAWAQKTQRFSSEPAPALLTENEEPEVLPAVVLETPGHSVTVKYSSESAVLALGQP
ncbi:MAG: hypothetical protein QNK37_35115 [Acidobacteriota bacterium]|nr:hypothetical protein [Acidobacteriota bacterium]